MTSETTGSNSKAFDADMHDQKTKKSYYHTFDDDSVDRMKKYFKVENNHDVLLKYLKDRKVPKTTPKNV
jgi:hypothetical protein